MIVRYRAPTVLLAAVLIAGVLPAHAGQNGGALSLDECIAQATASSQSLHSSRFHQYAAQARASSAQAGRWPTFSGIASYDYASEVTTIDIPFGQSWRSIEFGDGNTYRFAVGVDVPLYTGGALGAAAHAERAEAKATTFDVAADSLGIVHDVRTTFYRALSSRSQLDAARIAVRRLERRLEQVNGRIDIGTGSEEERVQATARLRESEQRMLAAELQSVTDELALGTAIGRPGERIAPHGDLDASPLTGAVPTDAAFESRPELAALEARRNESALRARVALGALLPSVVANAQMNYGRPGVDPVRNDWMSWASARVSLAWTLFDRGARHQKLEAARATARAVEAARTDVYRLLEGAFEAAQVRLDYAKRQSEKAAERLEAERRRLELVTGRRNQGMATESELLDAHDDLADAEAAEVAARAAVRLAESDLLYAAGR